MISLAHTWTPDTDVVKVIMKENVSGIVMKTPISGSSVKDCVIGCSREQLLPRKVGAVHVMRSASFHNYT